MAVRALATWVGPPGRSPGGSPRPAEIAAGGPACPADNCPPEVLCGKSPRSSDRARARRPRALALGAKAQILELHHRDDRIVVIGLQQVDGRARSRPSRRARRCPSPSRRAAGPDRRERHCGARSCRRSGHRQGRAVCASSSRMTRNAFGAGAGHDAIEQPERFRNRPRGEILLQRQRRFHDGIRISASALCAGPPRCGRNPRASPRTRPCRHRRSARNWRSARRIHRDRRHPSQSARNDDNNCRKLSIRLASPAMQATTSTSPACTARAARLSATTPLAPPIGMLSSHRGLSPRCWVRPTGVSGNSVKLDTEKPSSSRGDRPARSSVCFRARAIHQWAVSWE
jgi:hypothetical protein